MIIALAGRRVDPDGQDPRFPSDSKSVAAVQDSLYKKMLSLQATALVSSAACGADLLGLVAAGKLGIRRRVILPFDREQFRSTSVIDRPGDWGPIYDTVVDEVEAQNDLVIVNAPAADEGYIAINHLIVDEALRLAGGMERSVAAFRVWEGMSRGDGDLTEEFGKYAQLQGIDVFDIPTL